jgi:cytochrome c biogenesis protein
VAQERAGLPALKTDDATQAFMTQAVLALSDSLYYPAPVLLQLVDFKQVQASVFQVARAPGHYVVYLGAVLLILGVFAMLYVRERRLWIWIAPAADAGTQLTMALSTNRRTLDVDTEFEQMKQAIFKGTR